MQWSILKYTRDKTKEAYWWQNFLHDPRRYTILKKYFRRNFSSSTIFYYLLLYFHVKTGTRFALWDKRLVGISKVVIQQTPSMLFATMWGHTGTRQLNSKFFGKTQYSIFATYTRSTCCTEYIYILNGMTYGVFFLSVWISLSLSLSLSLCLCISTMRFLSNTLISVSNLIYICSCNTTHNIWWYR